jgi:DNA-binding MarR family transcriptional regulator
MPRGFDGFELDDFRDSYSEQGRDLGRGSSSSWDEWQKRQDIHRLEERADRPDHATRDRARQDRPPLAREERLQVILAQRVRTKYSDRNKEYSLRDSEIHSLGEIGKFRVVEVKDLSEFAYGGDRSRAENDIANLERQGLIQEREITDPEHNSTRVVSLTKEGHKLVSRGKIVPPSQAVYHGLKRPKEAFHDADLYCLYHKVSDEIEKEGGKIFRVKLDYQLKQELYARLARTAKHSEHDREEVKAEVAERYHLKVVSGKIPIPDLRIEYTNEYDPEIQRRDLELETEHYRPRVLSQKVRAGFELYARRGETDRLRRIRDDRELSAAILRL